MAISIKNLPLNKLKESLNYDSLTGIFTRKTYARPGKNAGGVDTYGYIHIGVNGKQYKAHQLAWLYHYGEIPSGEIDHINCDKQDNRIKNLRVVSSTINALNKRSSKGVYRHQSKYRARIKLNGKHLHLGLFETEELAKQAYLTAKKQYLGEFYGDY